MKQTLQLLMVLSISGLIAGCKLAAIVVEGGYFHTEKRPDCLEGSICIIEVTSTNYSESFTAVPDEGWYFEKWNSGDRFFCGGSTSLVCGLSLTEADGNVVIEELVASSETFYLMPVFKPAPDIITVNGKEWFQPYLFLNLSWNYISSVCPEGICDGMLNGHDMTGWTWASIEDVNALFNYYIGSEVLGPGPDSFMESTNDSNWGAAFYKDGWRPMFDWFPVKNYKIIQGYMRDLTELGGVNGSIGNDVQGEGFLGDFARTNMHSDPIPPNPYLGAWFYRTP